MEPPCRICARPPPPAASDPRVLENRYRSYVTRRREYCDLRRCNAKVGTNPRPEFDSRPYNVHRLVNKIQELNRNVQDLERSKHGRAEKVERRTAKQPVDTGITDLKDAHDAARNCLLDIERIRTFLADESSWWEMLKEQSVNCCLERSPHLHGVLNGTSVTLMLHEDGIEEASHRFAATPKRGTNVAHFSFRNSRLSSRERTNETKCTEQCTDAPWEERAEEYTVPCYSIDMKSTLIEVGSERHDATKRYAKSATKSKQNTVASEVRTGSQEDRSGEQRAQDRPYRSKETREKSQERKEKRSSDRSSVEITFEMRFPAAPPREVWYGQNAETMYEDVSRPRETFSSENTGSTRHITVDFTSNVDLNAEFPSRNATSHHKPRTKMVTEKIVYRVQKSPTRVSKSKSRD
ncbi:uncharacterized protein LOC116849571 isoform X2 [Odontomachus brunneus]|uniref:uncharacterized protein LOC116849571 isoform X2 n=1 Tax=Odontomachus brunneus TaxID=486640 RepID=UPI0013F2AD7B|nr:uncharacterized protein LOC116849571 isoform X2 [Odontomachus brunneus]